MEYYVIAQTKKAKFLKQDGNSYYLVIAYKNMKPSIKQFTDFQKADNYFTQLHVG